jgi:hypothetical protein
MRLDEIRFFKDETKHRPCKTTDVKMMILLFFLCHESS